MGLGCFIKTCVARCHPILNNCVYTTQAVAVIASNGYAMRDVLSDIARMPTSVRYRDALELDCMQPKWSQQQVTKSQQVLKHPCAVHG